jgi:plasmid segregation protein ParM
MKTLENFKIIGIDHGYGNMKTANHCFKTGIIAYDSEPLFTADMLVYNNKYYLIGEGHKEFVPDKIKDEDYYILTLVSIAKELKTEAITTANVHIAAGLPLTWTSGQKADFAAYLTKNVEVSFTYRKEEYKINIVGASIYPQGYAAIATFATKLTGINLIADIGNGTMNVLYMIDGKPQSGKMFTEKFGTYQCTLAIREAFMQKTQREINDFTIEEVLRTGTTDIPSADLKIIKAIATEYVKDIFRRLREHGYDENTMRLYVTGGGGCLVKNFFKANDRMVFVDDICAAAKGYEYLAEIQASAGKSV